MISSWGIVEPLRQVVDKNEALKLTGISLTRCIWSTSSWGSWRGGRETKSMTKRHSPWHVHWAPEARHVASWTRVLPPSTVSSISTMSSTVSSTCTVSSTSTVSCPLTPKLFRSTLRFAVSSSRFTDPAGPHPSWRSVTRALPTPRLCYFVHELAYIRQHLVVFAGGRVHLLEDGRHIAEDRGV